MSARLGRPLKKSPQRRTYDRLHRRKRIESEAASLPHLGAARRDTGAASSSTRRGVLGWDGEQRRQPYRSNNRPIALRPVRLAMSNTPGRAQILRRRRRRAGGRPRNQPSIPGIRLSLNLRHYESTARSRARGSVTKPWAGAWVTMISISARRAASWGVTPRAQKTAAGWGSYPETLSRLADTPIP